MELTKFIRSRLKIRHMNVLVALDDTLSVTRAAERLHVTQASVSRTLAEAEDGFGMPLFERHSRGLLRTTTGQQILQATRQILRDIAALETIASQISDLRSGEIKIGLQLVSALDQIANLISTFKTLYPNVQVCVRDGLLPSLLEDLTNGRLDVVFGRLGSGLDDNGYETRIIAHANPVLIASNPDLLQGDSIAELLEHPWVLPLPGTPMRIEFDRVCAAAGCSTPSDLIESSNPHLIIEVVFGGDRIGVAPTIPTELLNRSKKLHSRPFPEHFESYPVGAISVKNRNQAPAAAAFLEFVESKWGKQL